MKWTAKLVLVLVLVVGGPALMWARSGFVVEGDWSTASRDSVGLAPIPGDTPEAVIQFYAARAFEWRGVFAVHTWFAIKPAGASGYTVFQVTGWGYETVQRRYTRPDRQWFGNRPALLADIRGDRATRLIPKVEEAASAYPFPHYYRIWPGPNSNTFTAWVARRVPELGMEMPSTAIGKDYLSTGYLAPAPSGTGYQLSLYGVLGLLGAFREGLELNVLGLVFGIDPWPPAVKLPGLGRIGFGASPSTGPTVGAAAASGE